MPCPCRNGMLVNTKLLGTTLHPLCIWISISMWIYKNTSFSKYCTASLNIASQRSHVWCLAQLWPLVNCGYSSHDTRTSPWMKSIKDAREQLNYTDVEEQWSRSLSTSTFVFSDSVPLCHLSCVNLHVIGPIMHCQTVSQCWLCQSAISGAAPAILHSQ